MEVRIETLKPKTLVGMHLNMSFSANRTAQLWQGFMPRRREVCHTIGTELYSLQVYANGLDADSLFEKWAAVEVSSTDNLPEGMESFTLPGGLYAVFHYKGHPAAFGPAFNYIFNTWMPESDYEPDDRPHFEVLGEKYKNNDPDSEEDVWIPIRKKKSTN